MTDSIFDLIASKLEVESGLGKHEARGTLRIVLKAAGLDPKSVTPEQMSVALLRAMPKELESRGIAGGDAICREISESTWAFFPKGEDPTQAGDTAEDIFRRLGRSSET